MRMSIIGLIALGLVAAFSAALLMAAMGKTPGSMRANNSGDRDVTVLVPARDLPIVAKVRAEDISEHTIKAKDAPAGVLLDSVHAVGKVLTHPVVEGQPLTSDCFANNTRGMELVSDLPPGKRAVTVELKLSDGLEGLLYPGSVVDVLALFRFDSQMKRDRGADAVSTTLLRGVTVLAIDDVTASVSEDEKAGGKGGGALSQRKTRRVTLLVDSRQAEALQLASAQGTVSLAMRNPQDTTEADRDGTLLSGGQLASLAEYLGSWVGENGEGEAPERAPADPDPAPPAASAPPAAPPVTQSPKVSEWNVTVMRGDRIDVQNFVKDEEDKDAQRVAERLFN